MGLLTTSTDRFENSSKTQEDEFKVKVEVPEEREKEYTVHEGRITYPDGSSEEVTFDAFVRQDEAIILKEYTGYSPSGYHSGFDSRAFMFLPHCNFRKLETVSRRKDSFRYKKSKTLVVKNREGLKELKEQYDDFTVIEKPEGLKIFEEEE